jgi:hypothetical protein
MLVLVGAAVLGLTTMSKAQVTSSPEAHAPGPKPSPQELYRSMRLNMLQGSRAKFSLPPGSTPLEPWGVVMDQGFEKGTFTTVAVCDGSASIYLSNGGGYIGGKGQEPIRKAAEAAVHAARDFQAKMQPTTDYPIPEKDQVIFYLMTDSGVFTARASVNDLKIGVGQFSSLWRSMQNVVTEYRLWDQGGRKGGGGTLVPPK